MAWYNICAFDSSADCCGLLNSGSTNRLGVRMQTSVHTAALALTRRGGDCFPFSTTSFGLSFVLVSNKGVTALRSWRPRIFTCLLNLSLLFEVALPGIPKL
jgi:hypothetical protein